MPTRKDAKGRWHVEVCVGRKRAHRRLGPDASASDARRVEAELIRALHAEPAARSVTISGDPLLTQILADYTERHAYTLRSPDTARFHALRIVPWLKGRRASETRQVAAKIRAELQSAYTPATINRSLGALRKALALAWDRGDTAVDYSGLIKRAPENNARTTTLTMVEVDKLAGAADMPAVRAAIWIALFTGMRRGEILSLKPEDVGEEWITLRAGATKTLRTRQVPIIAPARPWLAQVPLGMTADQFKVAFARTKKAADLPHIGFHDLRRSCGTLLIRQGVSLHIVSKLLGHSSTQVTEKVYAHLAGDQLLQGLDVLTGLHRDLHRGKDAA